MTPVRVHTPLPTGTSLPDISVLLVAAGLTALSPTDWVAHCPGGDGVGVLLVVAAGDATAVNALEMAVREAVSRGERAIAVWALGTQASEIPAALEDFGAGLVIWDPAALHAAICGSVVEWQDAGGGVRKGRKIDRNTNC